MGEFADIYAIADERSVESIDAFLDEFLPNRRTDWTGWWEVRDHPRSPARTFEEPNEVVAYCVEHTWVVEHVCWEGEVRWGRRHHHIRELAKAYFLADGQMIFGVATPSQHPTRVEVVARRLSDWCADGRVVVIFETPPPETSKGFTRLYQSLPDHHDGSTVRCIRDWDSIND